MNIFEHRIAAKKALRAAKLELEQAKWRERVELAKSEVKRAEARMLNKPCPFQNGANCTSKCVHFSPGSVDKRVFMDGVYLERNYPRCKLWKQ